jgi:hypothetical protein
MAYDPFIPVATDSLATSQGQISGNFTLINGVLGSSTLDNGITKTTGDLLYASNSNTLTSLASAAKTLILHSGATPSWGGVNLAADVAGTLPIANGGTAQTTASYCNLASNVTGTLPVARGGTGTSAATSSYCNLATNVTGTLPAARGGSGRTDADHIIKAWISFTGDGTEADSFNASVSRDSAGTYTVSWTTDFADTNYCILVTVLEASGASVGFVTAQATDTATIKTANMTGTIGDKDYVYVLAIGAQ